MKKSPNHPGSRPVYDVIIIGAGPAGLAAAIYTSRELLTTLILDKGPAGGLVAITDHIDNYAGFPDGISGPDLIARIKKQAERFKTVIREFTEVTAVNKNGGVFSVTTGANESVSGKSVLIAAGNTPRQLGIPGEKEFRGKGVSYCATCDGAFFRDKKIVVIGGGDSAVKEAIFLTRFAREVVLVHRRDEFRAEKIIQQELFKNTSISLQLDAVPLKIHGETLVNALTIQNVKTNEQTIINTDGVFIFAGYVPQTGFLNQTVGLDANGYIKTDEDMQTNIPGIFAAGDIRSKKIRQISVAGGEGTVAAMAIREYLKNRNH